MTTQSAITHPAPEITTINTSDVDRLHMVQGVITAATASAKQTIELLEEMLHDSVEYTPTPSAEELAAAEVGLALTGTLTRTLVLAQAAVDELIRNGTA